MADEPGRRLVAVTGGASGIGLAVARAAAAEGWRVALADRDVAALDATDLPGASRAVLDVTDEAAVEAWVASLGSPDGVVTSAGIGADAHALDTTADLLRRILEVNVVGTFLCARAAARAMAASGRGGSVVLVASVAGLRGAKGRSAYGASKAAVVNMAQAMAVDLAASGVRVNALCPGPVDTPLVARVHDAATRAQWLREIPMARYGRPEEVAQAAMFLLDGARSGWVTGHALAVDGGYAGAGLMPPVADAAGDGA